MPYRVQRKRTSGWVSPDNTRYVGRPTVFGNPFSWKEVGRKRALELYRQWLEGKLDDRFPDLVAQRERIAQKLPELEGKNLSCWCPEDEPCHADVLIDLANRQQCNR